MAWEWSHAQEALDYANNYLHEQSTKEDLVVMAAEWDVFEKNCGFDDGFYDARLAHYTALPNDIVADYVWEKMEAFRTCTNGGYEFYGCPTGCHLIPVGDEEEED